ncbi:MAG: ABC transporter ATP-binding protein [Clostridiales bacterium]|nr:ABC transporter ATP-binding protein [Clostridiales bacterium]
MPLKIENISKSFGQKKVLQNLSLDLPAEGIVALLGNSGAGKTTLLRIIAGLETPDSGRVLGLEGKHISYVFQNDRLLKGFSALENVALVSDRETARLWLQNFGMGDALDKKPGLLSGGMRRRVALARGLAFAKAGGILLLDEPFKGLDKDLKQRIIPYVQKIAQDSLVILVTHDKKEAGLASVNYFIDQI